MTIPVLSVRNLEVEFLTRRSTLRAINGVSFDIAKGEVSGVFGSPPGKFVRPRVIGLIDPPGRTRGEIYLRERGSTICRLKKSAASGKRIAIFQDPLTILIRLPDRRPDRRDDPTHLHLSETARASASTSGRCRNPRAGKTHDAIRTNSLAAAPRS